MGLIIKALRQWRIRTRMVALLVIALTLVCLVAAAGVLSLQLQSQRTDEFINRSLHLSHQLSEINRKVGDINRAEKDMVIYYDDRITLKSSSVPLNVSPCHAAKTVCATGKPS